MSVMNYIWIGVYGFTMLIGLFISANQHGKPKNKNYNFWVSLVGVILQIFLMWGMGFFKLFSMVE